MEQKPIKIRCWNYYNEMRYRKWGIKNYQRNLFYDLDKFSQRALLVSCCGLPSCCLRVLDVMLRLARSMVRQWLHASFKCDAWLAKLSARKPVSIGRLRAGKPETPVNSGLAGMLPGDAHFTRGSGQGRYCGGVWRGCDGFTAAAGGFNRRCFLPARPAVSRRFAVLLCPENDWGCYWVSGVWGDSVGAGAASVSAGLGVGLGVGLDGAVEEADRSGWRPIGGVLSFQEAVDKPRSVIYKNNLYNNQWITVMLD